jgi:hypothetical protein
MNYNYLYIFFIYFYLRKVESYDLRNPLNDLR